MKFSMRLYAKIASIIAAIVIIDQSIAIFQNYKTDAITSIYFWLYFAIKVVPIMLLAIPLFYYGFKKQ